MQHPDANLVRATCLRSRELNAPQWTLDLDSDDGDDEESDDGGLAAEGDSGAGMVGPFELKVGDAEAAYQKMSVTFHLVKEMSQTYQLS